MNVPTAKSQSGKLGVLTKRMCKTRKVTYRVGYTWNRGGRLKELRIRHLARKFFHLWLQNTFGRITISKARSHYKKLLLRKVFSSWKDEWWHARKEWTLAIRADCHFKYVQYSKVYQAWQKYVSIQKEENGKCQIAANFAVQHLLRPVWDGWELYVEVRRLKRRMHETAIQHRRFSATKWAWHEWRAMLQHRRIEHHQEELAIKQWATSMQSRAWLRWKNRYNEACSLRKKEARAHIHFCHQLQRRALQGWITHTQHKQVKNQAKALAGSVWCSSVVRRHWCMWYRAFRCKQAEKERLQIADSLAHRTALRRTFSRWRDYVRMRSEKAEKKFTATQHHHHQLLCLGFKGLVLNVSQRKTHQINKNISVQHHQHTILMKYWRLWQMRLEQIEDQSLQPQMTIAVNQHRFLLLKVYMHKWRDRFTENQRMQDLELQADSFFKMRFLPRCVKSWRKYAEQKMERRAMRDRAELCHKEQLYRWAFYTWLERSTHLKEQRLAERMAVLHAEQTCLSRAWSKWVSGALQQRENRLAQAKAETLYRHTLLSKVLKQWKHRVKAIQISRENFEQAVVYDSQRCVRRVLTGWQEYVEYRKQKKNQQVQMNEHYERNLLMHMMESWKQHQTQHISARVEQCYQQHQRDLARRTLCSWRKNVLTSVEQRENETRAKFFYERSLLSKVLLAWHQRSAFTAFHHWRQEEALREARAHMDRVRMLAVFRRWRKRHGEVREERLSMEKACRHHQHVMIKKSFRAWVIFNHNHKDYQVMKNKSTEWHRLKTCQHFFLLWKAELQIRRKEAEQTEIALWHWSLNLQAKVLHVWRHWVTECHRKHGRLAAAAQFYRDELLRQGVTHILTYTAHMNAFSADMALLSHEQSSRQLLAVVRRCFLRWKQRTLWKPSQTGKKETKETEGDEHFKIKKSVSFCLPEDQTHTLLSVKTLVPEQSSRDAIMSKLQLVRASRLQPRRPDDLLCSPAKDLRQHSKHNWHSDTDNKSAPNNSVQKQHTWQTDPGSASLSAESVPVLSPPPSVLNPSTQHQSSLLISKPSVWTIRSGTSGNTVPLSCAMNKEPLLPPSLFTAGKTKSKRTRQDPSLLSPHYFTLAKPLDKNSMCNKDDDDEEETLVQSVFDPNESLTKELLEIKLDLQRYQQDRNQLQTWRKLQKVMRNWIQTTGSDGDTEERENTVHELNELEIRISTLSVKLAEQKPTMICHAARVSSLESKLQESRTT